MTINIDSLLSQLEKAFLAHPAYLDNWAKKLDHAIGLFLNPPVGDDVLVKKVSTVVNRDDRMVRSLSPLTELANQIFPEPDLDVSEVPIFAADGSQMTPDSGGNGMPIGVINLAAASWIKVADGKQGKIDYAVETTIYIEDDFHKAMDQIGSGDDEESLSVLRDVAEREWLARMMLNHKTDGFALGFVDGSTEIWGPRRAGKDVYLNELKRVWNSFQKLHERGHGYVGYVDQPNSTNLLTMLVIAATPQNYLADIRSITQNQIGGLHDRDIFEQLLPPGFRSSIYQIQGRAVGLMRDIQGLSTCCCFVNVGPEKQAHIIRLEFPLYIASQPEKADLIHKIVLEQCRVVPNVYYPFILTRVHEEAVLSPEIRAIIFELILKKFSMAEIYRPRPKDYAKTLSRQK